MTPLNASRIALGVALVLGAFLCQLIADVFESFAAGVFALAERVLP